MKLSAKASLLLSGLVLAVIAATSLFLFAYQQKAIKGLVRHQLVSDTGILALEIQGFVEENVRDLMAVAGNFPKDALRRNDREAIREYLSRQLSYFPRLESGIFILDRNGIFVEDFPPHPELRGQSFAHRDYFARAVSHGAGGLGDPYVSARTGLPVLTVTAPIKSDTGEIIALVCGSLNLLSRSGLWEQQQRKIGETGYVYVVDRAGRFIIHPDASRILTRNEPGKNVFLDRTVEGYEGAGETVNSQGVPMIIASRQISSLGWAVLAQVPEVEAFKSIRESVVALGLFFCAAMALVLPAGFWAMRRIAKPLEGLETAAQIISQDLRKADGALTRPFASSAMDALRKMRSGDEIGKLARAFFQLSVRLKQTLTSLRTAAEDWERTFSSVQEALFVLDAEGKVLRVNRVAEDRLRMVRSAMVARDWRAVLSMGLPVPEGWPTMENLRETGRLKLTTRLPETPGVFEFSFSAIQGRRGQAAKGFLLVVTDVSEKMEAEERIRELAFHDVLTALPNRMLLTDRLEQAMATADRNASKVGVMFLDLDDFKRVNDTYGHETGDRLLKQVARRLGECLRSNDTLARYAGDEFVAVLMDLKNIDEAARVASRMLESVSEPFDLPGGQARIGASIGIAVYPGDGVSPQQLISHADTAMYRAKGRGKNSFRFVEQPAVADGERLPTQ
ncbi:diguanylate cyclase domain-containing protein [Fundidesulfovibrio terrae]|uniref:diguanylate cyclase domain-containing protein n=1 Tax=Fundidesulfovibrio terrae TaxID=2922866 RepID=UPI001FAF0058|nr:diguanylate cyclase [Fundidesulfovibrio terrae]